ncbi:MAG: DUF799 domain-containing protein [Lautropia sp.]|nr:DUF799 domain-containing protein [Lautropia sp.]
MKKLSVILAALSVLALSGCATKPRAYDYSALKQSNPRSILVVMPVNHSPDVKGASSVLAQATVPLAEKGYYVFPVALVDEMFRQNGLHNGHDIQNAPIHKIREVFGADAIMYLDVEDYGSRYQLLNSTTTVVLRGRLLDLRTGNTLWEGSARAASGSGNSGTLIGALVSAAATQIIDTVSDRGYEVAGIATANLVNHGSRGGLLPGPYHPAYQQSRR